MAQLSKSSSGKGRGRVDEHATLSRLFGTLDASGWLTACCETPSASTDGERRSDLCGARRVESPAARGADAAGFVPLPARGYAPHRFFVAYDAETDTWFKVDAVSELIYGRPIKTLPTGLAADVLAARVRVGEVWGPAPHHEVITLLLHATLDKGRFDLVRAERLQQLAAQIEDSAPVDALLAAYWAPGVRWEAVRAPITAGEWSALLAQAPAVAARLRQRDPLGARTRAASNRLLRRLDRSLRVVRPAIPSVAVLGPDGAGKSTVADGIQDASMFPVRRVYMGLTKSGRNAQNTVARLGFAAAADAVESLPDRALPSAAAAVISTVMRMTRCCADAPAESARRIGGGAGAHLPAARSGCAARRARRSALCAEGASTVEGSKRSGIVSRVAPAYPAVGCRRD